MLKNMKVKKSLILGFGMVIVISLAIIIASLVMMLNQRSQYEILMDEDVAANEQILYARLYAVLAGRNYRDALLIPDSEANDELIATAEESLVNMENYLQLLDKNFPRQLTTELRDAYQDAARVWAEDAKRVISLYKQYDQTGNTNYLDQAEDLIYTTDTPLQNVMADAAETLDDQLVQGMAEEREKIENSIMTTIIVVLVVMVIATIFVIGFALILIKSITTPTEEVRRALAGFSEGKLSIPVEYESKNELGEMCNALRTSQNVLHEVISDIGFLLGEMAKGNFDITTRAEKMYVGELTSVLKSIRGINRQLSDTLTQIDQSAEQVSAGSEQVSTGAQALAQGATEQASAVQELSATVNEISASAQQNAKNSEEALSRSLAAGGQVEESAKYMDEMIQAMERISASSEEIGKIIATIENIAFQTNILALNAAVEAARAGSAGKGFAVVADEVRNLASKSDQAAKATKDLIERSVNSVKEGSEIVQNVSQSLTKTMELAGQAMEAMKLVAKAVEEESTSIAQVTEGIDQISSVVQTNSATSEQSAAASEELSSQAALMKELMSKFKLRKADSDYSYQPAAASGAEGREYAGAGTFSKY